MMTRENQSSGLRAGVGRNDITTGRAEARIRDPLYVKTLLLDDGSKQVAIMTLDAVAIGGICDVSDAFLPELRRRVQEKLGISGRHLLVAASHTHPPGRILCDEETLLERCFDTVRQALHTMIPVRVGAGAGHEERISINRDLRLKGGRHWTIRHANPCPPDEEIAEVGPIDPEIGILRIDRTDGRPFAVVYNFACHPLWADAAGSISANYPGVASNLIEDSLDVTALFLQGACGDIVDVHFKEFNRVRDIEPLGILLGLSTLKALKGIDTRDADLQIVSEIVKLPRRTDLAHRIKLLRLEEKGLLESLRTTSLNFKSFLPLYLRFALHPQSPSDYAFTALQAANIGDEGPAAMDQFNREQLAKYLQNINAMERLAHLQDDVATLVRHQEINRQAGEATVAAEIQVVRIGRFVLVTAPLEPLVEIGLNVKRNSPWKHTFVAGFANGYLHYGPSSADYGKGGYETTECFLAEQWQEVFERSVQSLIAKLELE